MDPQLLQETHFQSPFYYARVNFKYPYILIKDCLFGILYIKTHQYASVYEIKNIFLT